MIAVLHGAVIGGGMELAAAAHIRIAEPSAVLRACRRTRGIFLGSGGSVRLPRLIGAATVIDMMLSGRVYGAEEAHALAIVPVSGRSWRRSRKGSHWPRRSPATRRWPTMRPSSPSADRRAGPAGGTLHRMLMVGIAQSDDEAKQRLRDFLERKAGKVVRQ